MFDLDVLLLARIQFAFTVSFHIIFPAFTIGLASFLAYVEFRYLQTSNQLYMNIYKFWVKVFAVAFGMGVVSGIVMSYQFGTNWSEFSHSVGNVIGPLIGYEVLTAFFLEASFLGIMLFGWNRVGKKMHFFSTCMVALGTSFSAFWILSANSWMHTPAGFSIGEDGILYPEDWMEIIFNPSFPYRFFHMVVAAFLTTACVVTAVSAYYALKKRHPNKTPIMLGIGITALLFFAPVQALIGHEHGINTYEYQPAKVAAMEANWETQEGAPLLLFAWPDQDNETNLFEVRVPKMASWFVTGDADGELKGLKEFAAEDRPPVVPVFFSFRVMVGLGLLMIFIGVVGSLLKLRGTIMEHKWFLRLCVLMGPAGFVAVLAGWFVTEIGRQPWIAHGVMRTSEAVSPGVPQESVLYSLLAFGVVYFIVFVAGTYYIMKLFKYGPEDLHRKKAMSKDAVAASRPLSFPDEGIEKAR